MDLATLRDLAMIAVETAIVAEGIFAIDEKAMPGVILLQVRREDQEALLAQILGLLECS